MKYMRQFGVILLISMLGEILNALIPLPVPASIYGVILLFLALETRILPLSAVKDAASFLIGVMQLMFIPATVGLMTAWDVVRPAWLQYADIIVLTTLAVMVASGRATQAVIRLNRSKEAQRREGIL